MIKLEIKNKIRKLKLSGSAKIGSKKNMFY